MNDRVLEISAGPADITRRSERLVIKAEDRETEVALCDIGVLVLGHPAARISNGALSGCAEAGVAVVTCDQRYRPVAMLLPMEGHHLQVERLRIQLSATAPRKKRAWQEVVRAKVLGQASVLDGDGKDGSPLRAMAARVQSGDPDNVEAQAARHYWRTLFGPDFRRDPAAEDQNQHLNYGYAVLRAATARAIVGAGLHPSMGIHHHNRYDAFCLADDLMEPFRPLCDAAVVALVRADAELDCLSSSQKHGLVAAVLGRVQSPDGERTVADTLQRLVASLVRALAGERAGIYLPIWS